MTTKVIPFLNIQPRSEIRAELDEAYSRVMDSGNYILGKEVDALSEEFLIYLGVLGLSEAVCLNSGFDGLQLALRAYGVSFGDDVLVSANAPIPVYMAVSILGANPVPIDIDPYTYNVTTYTFKRGITRKTKAAIVVHSFGCPIDDIGYIVEEGRRKNIAIIEDCSHAHGAKTIFDYYVGTYADTSVFSFYPTKNMGGYGDGGIVISKDRYVIGAIRDMRSYGIGLISGINSRMDSLQAAFLRVRLKHLDNENDIRRRNAGIYLRHPSFERDVDLPLNHKGHVWHQFVINFDARDELVFHLKKRGIETMVHYSPPVYTLPYYALDESVAPVASVFAKKCLSLPIVGVTADDIDYVARTIGEFYGY